MLVGDSTDSDVSLQRILQTNDNRIPNDEAPLGLVFRRDIIGVADDTLMSEVMLKSPLVIQAQVDVETLMTQRLCHLSIWLLNGHCHHGRYF